MADVMNEKDIKKLFNVSHRNPLRSGEKSPYQVLKEDFYEMIRQREMTFAEFGLAIYLRGKACRFGNPFFLSNETIFNELRTTKRIFLPLRKKLRIKGVIKYNVGCGIGKITQYSMMDSVMIHKRDKR